MKFSVKHLTSTTLFAGLCVCGAAAWGQGLSPSQPGVRSVESQGKAPGQLQKLTMADRQKIQRIISLQIRAFERNDEAVAFSYATPDARRYFGTPRAFMEVVRTSYSALYKHASHEFLEAAVINGVVVQPLKILTSDGEIIVALYTVEQQADKEWRIGSCELAPSTLSAT